MSDGRKSDLRYPQAPLSMPATGKTGKRIASSITRSIPMRKEGRDINVKEKAERMRSIALPRLAPMIDRGTDMMRDSSTESMVTEAVTEALRIMVSLISKPEADRPQSPRRNDSRNEIYLETKASSCPRLSIYDPLASSEASSDNMKAELSPGAASESANTMNDDRISVITIIRRYLKSRLITREV